MIEGIITAMVTPFNKNEEINYDATKQLIERLISSGIDGLFILGTNGEFHRINENIKVQFVEKVVEIVNHRVPVYAGAGGNSTQEVIRLGKRMAAAGADALSIITPYSIPISENEIFTHYETIAENLSTPIILYNIPQFTGIKLSSELVCQLAKNKTIIGIKDSSGDLNELSKYIELSKNEDFSVLCGSDSLILSALELGAHGAVTATSNVLSKNNIEIYKNFVIGNMDQARYWQNSLEAFRRVLKYGSIPSVLKYSIGLAGIEVGNPVRPVLPIESQEMKSDINNVIKEYYNL